MLQRVRSSVQRMRREKTPITYQAVARRAGVSRTFLYQNPDARALVAEAAAQMTGRRVREQADQADQQEASWRERALNAEDALRTAHAEVRTQRTRIGELMGQVRDLEAEWTQEAIQRTTTENTTLRQRVRQLAQDNRALEERLRAARSNLRFQDRRLADLEAQLASPPE
jgi:chromosome segregation ATPase